MLQRLIHALKSLFRARGPASSTAWPRPARTKHALTQEQLAHFMSKGWVRLEGCLDPRLVASWVEDAKDRIKAGEGKCDNPVKFLLPWNKSACIVDAAPRMFDAICELIGGLHRLKEGESLGLANGFVVLMPERGSVPQRAHRLGYGGWHLDGPSVTRYLDSPVGLQAFTQWSDVSVDGGATAMACGTLGATARHLMEHPEGLPWASDALVLRQTEIGNASTDVVYLQGKAGDVVLTHPLMLHEETFNRSDRPRFMVPRMVELNAPPCFDRPDPSQYSHVERLTLDVLGVERLDFRRKTA